MKTHTNGRTINRQKVVWLFLALCSWGACADGVSAFASLPASSLARNPRIPSTTGSFPYRFLPILSSFSASSSSSAEDDAVTELLDLLKNRKKVTRRAHDMAKQETDRIQELLLQLEAAGSNIPYLDDEKYMGTEEVEGDVNDGTTHRSNQLKLWGNYELAYFDRSIDGGKEGARSDSRTSKTAKSGLFSPARRLVSKLLSKMFRLNYSFQHAVPPQTLVNFVGFSCLGLPASIVAAGNFTRCNKQEVDIIRNETGTSLRYDTTVRIDFEAPVLAVPGPTKKRRRFWTFRLGGTAAQSPPVTLCFTYLDDRLRLALASKGGRLVFTRCEAAVQDDNMMVVNDWKTMVKQEPVSARAVLVTSTAVSMMLATTLIPPTRRPLKILTTLVVLVVATRSAVQMMLPGTSRRSTTSKAE